MIHKNRNLSLVANLALGFSSQHDKTCMRVNHHLIKRSFYPVSFLSSSKRAIFALITLSSFSVSRQSSFSLFSFILHIRQIFRKRNTAQSPDFHFSLAVCLTLISAPSSPATFEIEQSTNSNLWNLL